MVKIKKKVDMTLSELIEWGFKNNIKNKKFISNSKDYTSVTFDSTGWGEFNNYFSPEDTFTVEVEEEITKETELPKYLEIYAHKSLGYGDENISIGKNQSIKEILKENKKYSTITKAIHLINDDGTHTLIWKDGELVGDE